MDVQNYFMTYTIKFCPWSAIFLEARNLLVVMCCLRTHKTIMKTPSYLRYASGIL